MSAKNISPLKFWICTDRPLHAIADELRIAGVIGEFSCDCENVYEWFTAKPRGFDIELNVSRKHHDDVLPNDEPLAFLFIGLGDSSPTEDVVRELARNVRVTLAMPVFIGSIEYLGGDDFRYSKTEAF